MTEKGLNYFAYGANLHPKRLQERAPSAQLIGTGALAGHRLVFNKRSTDGSGKCTFVPGATEERVYGAVYSLSSRDKAALDDLEGLGRGYDEVTVSVPINGAEYACTTYVGSASHLDAALSSYDWYKNLVLAGVRYHCFPGEYVKAVVSIGSIADANAERRAKWERLVKLLNESLPTERRAVSRP